MTREMPESLAQSIQRVQAATRELILAAERGDADAIEQAIHTRGDWIAEVRVWFENHPQPELESLRMQVVQDLALQADDAELALRGLTGITRKALSATARGGDALRGYARNTRDPSALDRSG